MRSYSNALKAGVLGLSMLAAAPAFSSSAHAGSAPSVDIAALQQDPVHQAAIKASANKIVFVLGGGVRPRPIAGLKSKLVALGLEEGKHFELLSTQDTSNTSGVIYIGTQILKATQTDQPFVFDQYASEEAVSIIRQAIKAGKITIAALELRP